MGEVRQGQKKRTNPSVDWSISPIFLHFPKKNFPPKTKLATSLVQTMMTSEVANNY